MKVPVHPALAAIRFPSSTCGMTSRLLGFKSSYNGSLCLWKSTKGLHQTSVSYGEEKNYLKASFDTDIPTVKLSFDKFSEYKSPAAAATTTGSVGEITGLGQKKKSPIVILHGLFGSKANNRTVAKQLSALLTRDVYCVDLRNHGDSEHLERHDYPALASDVEEFLKGQNLVAPKPIIIGHSMGAKTAMAVSLRKPSLPKFIISVDNAPISYSFSSGSKFATYVRALLEITEGKSHVITSRTQADELLKKYENSLPIRQFLLTNISRKSKQEILDEYEANKKQFKDISKVPVFKSRVPLTTLGRAIDSGNIAIWPFDSAFTRFKGPTLFIRGTESTYIPDDIFAEIGKFFPKFETKDVEAGHWLISENPKAFVETVKDWIEFKEEVLEDEDNANKPII